MTEGEAQAEIGTAPLTYEKTISVRDAGGELWNIINYRQYNKARKGRAQEKTVRKKRRS